MDLYRTDNKSEEEVVDLLEPKMERWGEQREQKEQDDSPGGWSSVKTQADRRTSRKIDEPLG